MCFYNVFLHMVRKFTTFFYIWYVFLQRFLATMYLSNGNARYTLNLHLYFYIYMYFHICHFTHVFLYKKKSLRSRIELVIHGFTIKTKRA